MDYLDQDIGQGEDLEAVFVKDFLISELGLELGVDFSFTCDELLLSQKSFLAVLAAIPDQDAKEFIMSITIVD
jgi:hypothetical protein